MAPLFSIITVTYNAGHTIERTIESVKSQTCQLYEHIVMDGLSTDDTVERARRCGNARLQIVSKKDNGIYDAMNNAMDMAQGDYLIFLNAGDKLHSPDTLQQLADAILANDYPGIVYGQTDIVDDEGNYLGPRHLIAPEELTLDSFKQGMVVCHQAMCVLRQIARHYNLKYRYSADYEWVIICLQHSRKNVYLPQTIVDYLSEGVTTAHHFDSLKERYRIMATYYGGLTALGQHVKFVFRYLRRRKGAANKQ